jgi:hypothetical protein
VHARVSNKGYWGSVNDNAKFLLPAYTRKKGLLANEKAAADAYFALLKPYY